MAQQYTCSRSPTLHAQRPSFDTEHRVVVRLAELHDLLTFESMSRERVEDYQIVACRFWVVVRGWSSAVVPNPTKLSSASQVSYELRNAIFGSGVFQGAGGFRDKT